MLLCLTICVGACVGCPSPSSGVLVWAAKVRVSPVAFHYGAVSAKFLQWHSSVVLSQLSFSNGVPVYPASIRWVAQRYPSVHWVNQWHSSGISVYTGPASVHWLRIREGNAPVTSGFPLKWNTGAEKVRTSPCILVECSQLGLFIVAAFCYIMGDLRLGIGNYNYDDVIMSTIASQITSLTSVYSTVYSDADQSKHQSSASLAFVWGIHRGPVNSPHKWPVTRKMFSFDDVIMTMHIFWVM